MGVNPVGVGEALKVGKAGLLIRTGRAGWWTWVAPGAYPGRVELRFAETDTGIRVHEVHTVGEVDLLHMHLNVVERVLNAPSVRPRVLPAVQEDAGFNEALPPETQETMGDLIKGAVMRFNARHDARIAIPEPVGGKRPDSFYERLADLHAGLMAGGNPRPARAIAEQNGVPISRVYRFLAEAKRRGLTPRGERKG